MEAWTMRNARMAAMVPKGLSRVCVLFFLCAVCATAQMPQGERIPLKQAIDGALKTISLTHDGKPFHAVLKIANEDADSPYKGSVEIHWISAEKYRIVATSPDFTQTLIVNNGQVQETDSGDFYPGWLRNFVTALMNPLPRADEFLNGNAAVFVGPKVTNSCVGRDDRPGGITDQMTWAQICFEGSEPKIAYELDFTYAMEFADYKKFGKKQIARKYTMNDSDEGATVGTLTTLEEIGTPDDALFAVTAPTPVEKRIATKFISTKAEEKLLEQAPTITWPPAREGKTDGYMIVHVITDRTGQVREAWKHNSDNAGLESFGREQALKYKFHPLLVNGVAQQMEAPLVLHFITRIANPVPVLTGAEINKVASGCGEPKLPSGLAPSGTKFRIRISVNETGKVTGTTYPDSVPRELMSAADRSVQTCKFSIYKVDGKPSYYHAEFVFSAP